MAEHAAEERRRNWLIALGAAALLLILLALTLSFCDNTSGDDNTKAAPGTTASTETLPPVSGPAGSPGTLSPKTSAPATGNDPTGVPAPTTPLATKSPAPSPSKRASTKPTPAGGVDAGGGSGLTGRRASLLVAGVFLLLAALVTARFAVGRAARD